MQNLRKRAKKIMDTRNRLLCVVRRASPKKFIWFIGGYFIVVTYAIIIMPSAVQTFSSQEESQISEIEIPSLNFSVVSIKNFVKRGLVRYRPDVVPVSEKENPELGPRVDILIPSGYTNAEDDTYQGSDDARKAAETDQYNIWEILFHAAIISCSLFVGSHIGGVLAILILKLMYPSNADILRPSTRII